ncbi:MAG: hypothetical protein GXY88_09545 [Tissierellia bacterium]|nr:hypothetical protein [Tissierellia bacterium]
MKLIIAIVQDEYATNVIKSLMSNKYRTTKLSSTGGFLKSGNTTLLIGVENGEVDHVIELIRAECKEDKGLKEKNGVEVGAANIFVLNMANFMKL